MMIYSFPSSLGVKWDKEINRRYKKWLGVNRAANPDILYRSKAHAGLGLKQPLVVLRTLQVTKARINTASKDSAVRNGRSRVRRARLR